MAAFSRQAIAMTWDYVELNPLLEGTGSLAAIQAATRHQEPLELARHPEEQDQPAARGKLNPVRLHQRNPDRFMARSKSNRLRPR